MIIQTVISWHFNTIHNVFLSLCIVQQIIIIIIIILLLVSQLTSP